jgi:catechol 2,3-dioxygenase-like lactoylglutathione lyase family enzyme
MSTFNIAFLDHVAIRVRDIAVSAEWYKTVLGLTEYKIPEWGEFPVFLLAGKSGIALFPANSDDPPLQATSKNVKIDHFAFNVARADYDNAKKHYAELGIDFTESDHHFFHSIYTRDPDGHTVELTTIVVSESDFYK